MRRKRERLAAAFLAGIIWAGLSLCPAMAEEKDTPPLVKGEHEQWIDRVQLPEYAREFYDLCTEATDNDGYRDYFIEDKYFEKSISAVHLSTEYLETMQKGDFLRTHEFTGIYVGKVKGEDKDYALRSVGIAYQAFLHDYPQIFWLGGQWQRWFADEEANTVYLFFVLEDVTRDSGFRFAGYTENTIRAAIEERDANVSEILSEMPGEAGEAEKARYFHDVLTKRNQYNLLVAKALAAGEPTEGIRSEMPVVWECISALSGRTGIQGPVCYAYAKAFKVLCDQVDLPCVITTNPEHVWNEVKIGDRWYAVDVMRDDPALGTGAASGYEQHDYLLVGSGTPDRKGVKFLDSHPVENRVWLYPGNVPGLCLTNGPKISERCY